MSSLPTISIEDINKDTFYGTYPDYERLTKAINDEIDGLNIYKVVDENGRLLAYTFEVKE